jgi:hypothetical protein
MGYKVEDKLPEQKKCNATVVNDQLRVHGKVVSITCRPAALYLQEISWYSFLSHAESTEPPPPPKNKFMFKQIVFFIFFHV